jgi:hypothetical protein
MYALLGFILGGAAHTVADILVSGAKRRFRRAVRNAFGGDAPRRRGIIRVVEALTQDVSLITSPGGAFVPKLSLSNYHSWGVHTEEAHALQVSLAGKVSLTPQLGEVRLVAGVDMSAKDVARAAVVLLSYPELQVLEVREPRSRWTSLTYPASSRLEKGLRCLPRSRSYRAGPT